MYLLNHLIKLLTTLIFSASLRYCPCPLFDGVFKKWDSCDRDANGAGVFFVGVDGMEWDRNGGLCLFIMCSEYPYYRQDHI